MDAKKAATAATQKPSAKVMNFVENSKLSSSFLNAKTADVFAGMGGDFNSEVKKRLNMEFRTTEGGSNAGVDFSHFDDNDPDEWKADLKRDANGNIAKTSVNIITIIENDQALCGHLWRDTFRGVDMVAGGLPWRETATRWDNSDDANLRVYLENEYGITGRQKVEDAVTAVFTRHSRNPLQEYLRNLKWDNTERLDTLFIYTLGAVDTPLNRAVTRMHFTAAVARAMTPGVKYDNCLILCGREGIGKSTLLSIMAGEWFNDSLTLSGMDTKNAMEQVREGWIFELSELSGLRKSELEPIKAFITKTSDTYRPAYGRVSETAPRHCVFFGTTNETAFLKGDTGNRRFLVMDCGGGSRAVPDMLSWVADNRNQIWAEAVFRWQQGEQLYLSAEMAAEARRMQTEHHEANADAMRDQVEIFLATPIPTTWEAKTPDERRRWYQYGDNYCTERAMRAHVCAAAFLCEYCGKTVTDRDFNTSVRRFNCIMRTKEEWEEITNIPASQIYGRPRGFRRKNI